MNLRLLNIIIFTTTIIISTLDIDICNGQVARETLVASSELKRNVTLNFKFDSAVLDSTYLKNAASLSTLDDILGNKAILSNLDSVVIEVSTSPEGHPEHNMRLSKRRADAIRDYIVSKHAIAGHKIIRYPLGENWIGLRRLIEADSNITQRQEALDILDTQSDPHTREAQIKQLGNGRVWSYISNNYLRHLRTGAVCAVFFHRSIDEVVKVESSNIIEIDTLSVTTQSEDNTHNIQLVASVDKPLSVYTPNKRPAFSIKTNLLYYTLGVLNIGGEFYMSDKLSIDVPITYSPYSLSRNYTFQTLSIQPECRYWLNSVSAGHFAGIHTHVAYYNVAIDNKSRYQDKGGSSPLWGFGFTYGYALPLKGNWGMEFLIGAGYANIKCDEFYNIPNGALVDSFDKNYWGITRVGVNLIYKFNKQR